VVSEDELEALKPLGTKVDEELPVTVAVVWL
jgi:hypothetical protein